MKKIFISSLSIVFLITSFQSADAFSFKQTLSNVADKFKWKKSLTEDHTVHEKLSPNTRIVISNLKGNIRIKTWNRDEITATISRKGSEAAYNATKVSAGMSGDTFTLKTLPVNEDAAKDAKKCTVTYDIVVPKHAKLHSITTQNGKISISNTHGPVVARSEKGTIALENISGGARVHAKHGNIVIKAQEITSKHTILAVSDYGNIRVKVPKSMKDANVVARTKKGTVTSEFPITTTRTMQINRKTVAQASREISGTIGKGGTTIKLETLNGNIKLISS